MTRDELIGGILLLAASLLFSICAANATQIEIRPAYTVENKSTGKAYPVIELLEHKRDHINPVNILRLRRGTEFYRFSVADSTYPVRIDASMVDKQQLKGILDKRAFGERHPNWAFTGKAAACGLQCVSNFIR